MHHNTQLLIKKAKRVRIALYLILNNKSPIPIANRLSIYKIYVKPIVTYAAAVWGFFINNNNWKNIKAVQNIAICIITGVHYITNMKH